MTAGPPDRARAGRQRLTVAVSQALGPLISGCPWTSPREASQIHDAEAHLWLCRQTREEAGQVDDISPSLSGAGEEQSGALPPGLAAGAWDWKESFKGSPH